MRCIGYVQLTLVGAGLPANAVMDPLMYSRVNPHRVRGVARESYSAQHMIDWHQRRW